MFLKDKTALVFCATGQIAQASIRALHRHGATIQLAARTSDRLSELQQELNLPHPPLEVDVMDEAAIAKAFKSAVQRMGSVDIVFNGVGPKPNAAGYGTLAAHLDSAQFSETLLNIVTGQFNTASAASQHWHSAGQAGTLLFLTSSMSRVKMAGMPALSAASAAVEGLMRSLAGELGPIGGRAICINPTALPQTSTIQETSVLQAKRMGIPVEVLAEGMATSGLTGRGPTLAEVGELVAFAASEAGAILNSHVIDADRGTPSVI